MTDRQKGIMEHALGRMSNRVGKPDYRNRYVVGPMCDVFADCEALVAAGMMSRRAGSELTGGCNGIR